MHYQWDFYFLLRYIPLLWTRRAGHAGLHRRNHLHRPDHRPAARAGPAVALVDSSTCRWSAFIEAFRCTPLLVQIVWFYYALPVLLGIQIPAVAAAS